MPTESDSSDDQEMVVLSIRIPPKTEQQLRDYGEERGLKRSGAARQILTQHFRRTQLIDYHPHLRYYLASAAIGGTLLATMIALYVSGTNQSIPSDLLDLGLAAAITLSIVGGVGLAGTLLYQSIQ